MESGNEEPGVQENRAPQQRLDDLLSELQERVSAVRETRDRVHSLLKAVLEVGRGLELDEVLRHIVEAAVSLVDARYGVLGVIDQDGRHLARFVTVGLSEQEVRAIGPLPPHHPPMRRSLGMPILVRDQVFGNLHLTDKRGRAEFDAEDEAVLSTLAAAAGIAVDNARLYATVRLRERWLRAGAEVTAALLSGVEHGEVLALILRRAQEITGADLAVVALPGAQPDELVLERAVGEQAEAYRGLVLPLEGSLAGAAIRTGQAVTSPDVQSDERITNRPLLLAGLGPAVAVPLGSPEDALDAVHGALILARRRRRPEFPLEEVEPLVGYAGQIAVALELAERRRAGEQLALLEDHDRIARDLNDLAIQRIFASGMTLQSTVHLVANVQATERMQQVIDDLDETVHIIRTTIFGLRTEIGIPGRKGLRARAVDTVDRMVPVLGFTPALRLEGLLDARVPEETAEAALAALGEALTNVARHAGASSAQVVLTAGDDLTLTVTDDGSGLEEGGPRSGLRNLAERAERLGGRLVVGPGPGAQGTRLAWEAPLPKRS